MRKMWWAILALLAVGFVGFLIVTANHQPNSSREALPAVVVPAEKQAPVRTAVPTSSATPTETMTAKPHPRGGSGIRSQAGKHPTGHHGKRVPNPSPQRGRP